MSRPENAQISEPVKTGAATHSGGGDSPVPRRRPDGTVLALGCALFAVTIAAYCRTFGVPFIFDDLPSIVDNPSIRHLRTAFLPPGDSTVGGRPVLNASLAVNYAVSGLAVWSYHALNVAIHALAGLVLFGIVRRTLAARMDGSATLVGFCAALVWALHPLLTESVTYVIQRGESLMGLFLLLTLYCLIRGAASAGRAAKYWYGLSVATCLLGMGTKEVMVSAPLVALLYDRTFLSGSYREAWRRRRWVYAGLAATWLILPFLVISTHGRNGSAGYGQGVTPVAYALTQFPAIVHYLRLSFWPFPLIFDYGSAWRRRLHGSLSAAFSWPSSLPPRCGHWRSDLRLDFWEPASLQFSLPVRAWFLLSPRPWPSTGCICRSPLWWCWWSLACTP